MFKQVLLLSGRRTPQSPPPTPFSRLMLDVTLPVRAFVSLKKKGSALHELQSISALKVSFKKLVVLRFFSTWTAFLHEVKDGSEMTWRKTETRKLPVPNLPISHRTGFIKLQNLC